MSSHSLPLPAGLPEGLLPALLDLLPTGVVYYTPLRGADGAVTDFALAYLNPAAQRLLGLPAQPTATLDQHWPAGSADSPLAQLRAAWQAADAPTRFVFDHPQEGATTPVRVLARRQGEGLLALLNYADEDAGQALQASQAREQAAHAEAERQRGELQRVFEQAPLAIAVYRGPHYTIELANPTVARLWGRTREQLIGKGLFEALPEVAGMGYEQLLDEVMATGVPYVAHEMPAHHDRNGQRETVYWTFVYEPMRNAGGRIDGAMVVATDVTEQVLARQQLQQLNEELELRVTARSAEARAALFEAEQQRERLREQQQVLKQILGQVPAAIATLSGPQHRFAFFNDAYHALVLGRAVLGRPVAEVLPELEDQGFIALLDQVYASGQPFVGTEIQLMLHDAATGQPVQHYLDFIYQPLFDEQRQPQGIMVFAVDVTGKARSRKQADTLQAAMLAVARRQAQERQDLFQLFEQTPAAIVLLREPDHRIDYFNPAFAELFPPEEWAGPLRGHTLAEVYPRIRQAGLVALLDEVYRTGESQLVPEMPLADLQPGSPRFVTLAYQAYREQERIVGVAAFIYDVTEQVLTRQAVEANAHRLRLLTDALPVLIGYLDRDHVYRFANQAYRDWFNQDPAALLGRPVREVVGEAAYQVARPRMERALAGERVDFDARMPYREDFVKHIHTSYIPDVQAGEVQGFYTLVSDVTEQVLAREQVQGLNEELAAINEELQVTNEELLDSNTRLSRTNADLDTFVYTASHDLKSPITNVEGLLAALREHLPAPAQLDPLVPRLLEMMEGAVVRFQQTLAHLTDVSRLQQTLLEQPAEEVNLPALVEAVRLDILPELTAANATLTLDLMACPTVHFPAKNLRSVIYNLLSNAVKYRDPARPPQVALRCHCTPGWVVLAVQDNGLGLTAAQQGELFQMFRRLHSHVPGSGVGLYMVKKMVENVGGRITVESESGRGSTFTVSLPDSR